MVDHIISDKHNLNHFNDPTSYLRLGKLDHIESHVIQQSQGVSQQARVLVTPQLVNLRGERQQSWDIEQSILSDKVISVGRSYCNHLIIKLHVRILSSSA